MNKLLEKYLPFYNAPDAGGGGGGDTSPDPAASASGGGETILGGMGDPDPASGSVSGSQTQATAEDGQYKDDPNLSAEENAAKKAEHDAGKGKGDEGGDVDPASYDLTAPEGYDVDPEVESEFREFAASNKFSKETVGALRGFQVKMIEKQAEQHTAMVADWGNQVKADKEIGGANLAVSTAAARAAMQEFFPPDARAILEQTGLGNHPAIVKGMARVGRAMGEHKTISGNPTTNVSRLDILYPEGDK